MPIPKKYQFKTEEPYGWLSPGLRESLDLVINGGQLPQVTVSPTKGEMKASKQRAAEAKQRAAEKEAFMGNTKKPNVIQSTAKAIKNIPRNSDEIFENTMANLGVLSPANWIATGASALDAGLGLIPGYQRDYDRIYWPTDKDNPRLSGISRVGGLFRGNPTVDEVAGVITDFTMPGVFEYAMASAPRVARGLNTLNTKADQSIKSATRPVRQAVRKLEDAHTPTVNSYLAFKDQNFPTNARWGTSGNAFPNFANYFSTNRNNDVRIHSSSKHPAASVYILPEKGSSTGAARDMQSFIEDILPDYATLASDLRIKTASQLSPKELLRYIFKDTLPNPIEEEYSLDVAKQLYGYYKNPKKYAKKGIRVEISPNTVMRETNDLSQNFKKSFPDIRALAPDVDLTKFENWTPAQIDLWNHKYTQLNYPPIDPEKRTMPYLVFKKIPKKK